MSALNNSKVQFPAVSWTAGTNVPNAGTTGSAMPLLTDATTGRLMVDALTASSADLSIIQGKQDTTNGILTSQAADVSSIAAQVGTSSSYLNNINSSSSIILNHISSFDNGDAGSYLYSNNNNYNPAIGYNTQTGGFYTKVAAASTNVTLVYGSDSIANGDGEPAPILGGFTITNIATSTRYFKLYDLNRIAYGSDTPIANFAIPATQTLTLQFPNPWSFENGISFAFSTSSTVLSPVSVGDLILNLWYSQHSSY